MSDSINYQALYDLIASGDPRGTQAAKNLTADEQRQFFDFQKRQAAAKGIGVAGKESNRADANDFLSVAEAVPALGAMGAGGLAGMASGAIGAGAKLLGRTALGTLPFIAADKGMQYLGVPQSARSAILVATGLWGGLTGAAKGATEAAATPAATVAESAVPEVLSTVQRAQLTKQGYTPELIAKIESALQEQASQTASPVTKILGSKAPSEAASAPEVSAIQRSAETGKPFIDASTMIREQEKMRLIKQLLQTDSFSKLTPQ